MKPELKEGKAARITKEISRLKRLYTKVDKKNKAVVEGLISRAAYMMVTLEDYEKDLDESGYVEMFSQSPNADPYERERPVARLYNAMNKNYQSIMKQLADILPPPPKQEEKSDGFEEFVGRRAR